LESSDETDVENDDDIRAEAVQKKATKKLPPPPALQHFVGLCLNRQPQCCLQLVLTRPPCCLLWY